MQPGPGLVRGEVILHFNVTTATALFPVASRTWRKKRTDVRHAPSDVAREQQKYKTQSFTRNHSRICLFVGLQSAGVINPFNLISTYISLVYFSKMSK